MSVSPARLALLAIAAACSSRPAPSPPPPSSPPPVTATDAATPSKYSAYAAESDDKLIEHRVIRLKGPITDALATQIIAKLLFLQHQDAHAPIALIIESPGGGLAPTFAIRDTMDQLGLPIATHTAKAAEGSALLLLAHGARGQRTAATGAVLSFTPADESSRATTLAVEALAGDTGQPAEAVEREMTARRRFDAASARAYGLIDRVED